MTALLILVAVLIVLLVIPVELEFAAQWPSQDPVSVRVYWCFGLISSKTSLATGWDAKSKAAKGSEKKVSGSSGALKVRKLFGQRRFRVRVYHLVSSVWRAVRKRDVNIHFRLGAGDPAETGRLWAILGPLSGWLQAQRSCTIALVPDFDNAVFEGGASGRLGFAPVRLLAPVIAFVCSPVLWRSIARARAKS